jgi:hypothetical protein
MSSRAAAMTTLVCNLSFHSASVKNAHRVDKRRSNQPTNRLLVAISLAKKSPGKRTRLKRSGSHGGSPMKYRVANNKITNPNGVESPGMVMGVENGKAHRTINNAEARAPRASKTSPNAAGRPSK